MPSDLDPNRPHGLDDVIDRMLAGGPQWLPSFNDVCRVREYIGMATWAAARDQHSNDYNFASSVLTQLSLVNDARAAVAPYVAIACEPHGAAVGAACDHDPPMFMSDGIALGLPSTPLVCAWRVLAKHDRLAAMALFERPSEASRGRRQVLGLSGPVENGVAVARVQHRHPSAMVGECVRVSQSSNWTVRDIRVDDMSVIAPHLDLPGFLFGAHVIGCRLTFPVMRQDQWFEVVARRDQGTDQGFYASLLGTISG